MKFLAQTSMESATWHHPEHRFYEPLVSAKGAVICSKSRGVFGDKISNRKTAVAKRR